MRDKIPKGLLCSMSKVESSFLCHCRLSHPCLSKLQQALPWITIKSFTCQSCELDKQHRVTYRRPSTFVSESPFELVHWDQLGCLLFLVFLIILSLWMITLEFHEFI